MAFESQGADTVIVIGCPRGTVATSAGSIETVVSADLASWVVDTIRRAAFTGRAGDGKIFVIRVEEAVQIRSGEKGPQVL